MVYNINEGLLDLFKKKLEISSDELNKIIEESFKMKKCVKELHDTIKSKFTSDIFTVNDIDIDGFSYKYKEKNKYIETAYNIDMYFKIWLNDKKADEKFSKTEHGGKYKHFNDYYYFVVDGIQTEFKKFCEKCKFSYDYENFYSGNTPDTGTNSKLFPNFESVAMVDDNDEKHILIYTRWPSNKRIVVKNESSSIFDSINII